MHSVKRLLVWLAAILCLAIQVPGSAVADVIVLNDGRLIETPRALVEGTQVFYYQDDKVLSLPHAQVLEIRRSEAVPVAPADEAPPAAVDHFYRLVFTDGRTARIDDYTDAGDTIRYAKFGVRVTLDKSVIRTITRVSDKGEEVVFRHGGRLQSLPVERRREGEASLHRMSEESRERAVFNAVVDEKAMDREAAKEQHEEGVNCLDRCMKKMLACRDKCVEVLDTLRSRLVAEKDPAFIMVRDEVVAPCKQQCVANEATCRNACGRAPAPPKK